MYLKKTPNSHGRIRLSIVDTYYDKAKKCSRQKTVESIGWLDELEKQYDDPITHFTKRVAELNEEKQKKQAPIHFTFYNSDRLCVGDDLRKNFGYAALSQIYHELGIHTFLTNRQRHSKEQYDANAIMKMLVYSRLLFPASKKSSYDGRNRFFEKSEYSLDDVYRCLSFLDKHRESLQIWMNDYMLLTSEMETSDDEIIDIYRGLWRIEESFKVTKSELEARPVYVWTKEHIEAHFLTCFVALTIARILENKLEHKYSVGKILDSLSKAECSLVQQNYYLFDYYDEVLREIGLIMDIDFGKRIRTLGEIKKILAKTKK